MCRLWFRHLVSQRLLFWLGHKNGVYAVVGSHVRYVSLQDGCHEIMGQQAQSGWTHICIHQIIVGMPSSVLWLY